MDSLSILLVHRHVEAWAVSVVVITSALHAEGRQFEPGTAHFLLLPRGVFKNLQSAVKIVRLAEWSKAPDSRPCLVP